MTNINITNSARAAFYLVASAIVFSIILPTLSLAAQMIA